MKTLKTPIILIWCFAALLSFTDIVAQITVVSPSAGAAITQCSAYIIRFTSPQYVSNGVAEVYKNGVKVQTYYSMYQSTDNNVNSTGLGTGTDYQIKIYDGSNPTNFGWSGTFSIVSIAAPIATAASSVSINQFIANWNAVTGATDYRIDISTSPDFSSFVLYYNNYPTSSLTGGTTSKVVSSGIEAGTTYYYRLRTVRSSCVSGNSNVIPIPHAPTAVQASNITTSCFDANWTSVTGASHYLLTVSTQSNFSTCFVCDQSVSGTTQQVCGLNGCSTYYYRVQAVNISPSAKSNSITVVTSTTPPVTVSATNINTTSFTANWQAVSCAASYRLDVSTNCSFSSFLNGYNNRVVSGIFEGLSGLTANATYYYRVRAVSQSGLISSNSSVRTVTLGDYSPLNLTATNVTSTSALASWSAVNGTQGYQLFLERLVSAFNYTPVSGYNPLNLIGTSATIQNLVPNTQYRFRIRSDVVFTGQCGVDNGWSVFSLDRSFITASEQGGRIAYWENDDDDTDIQIEEENSYEFTLYPNPVKDRLLVKFPLSKDQAWRFKIIDLDGREHKCPFLYTESGIDIDVSLIKKNVYILLLSYDKRIYRKRFIRI